MKTRVLVLFGGQSVEHEVAIISAVQAMNYLNADKYDVLPVYITKEGKMLFSKDFLDINVFKRGKLSDLDKTYQSVIITLVDSKPCIVGTHRKKGIKKCEVVSEFDVALPVVHGTNCEDGTLQGWLELLNVPYTGCDVMSSAIGMDKDLFKLSLLSAGLPTLPHFAFRAKEWAAKRDEIVNKIEEKFGYPVIVKPANLGSSVGISKAKDQNELVDAIDLATSFAQKVLVEHAITNLREINCSVLGDADECAASECEEPMNYDDVLTFSDKYLSNGGSKGMASLKRRLPADISDEKKTEIQTVSTEVFKLIGAAGVVRIDYLLDCDNDKVYVNEINTIPGSLAFYLWEATGIKYPEMLDKLIELAFKRQRTKESLVYTYESNILEGVGGFKGSKGSKM